MLDMFNLFVKGVFIVPGSGVRGVLRELFVRLSNDLSKEYTQDELDYGIIKTFSYNNLDYYDYCIPIKEIKTIINTTLGEGFLDVQLSFDSRYDTSTYGAENKDLDYYFTMYKVKRIRIHFGEFLKMIFPHSNIEKIVLMEIDYIEKNKQSSSVYWCRRSDKKESRKIQKIRYGQQPTTHFMVGMLDANNKITEIFEPAHFDFIDGEFVYRYLRNPYTLETLYFDILQKKRIEAERIEIERNEREQKERLRLEEEEKRRQAETDSERRSRIYSQTAKDPTKLDHYQLLGVSFTATDNEIREAYLKIIKKIHPDVTHDDFYHQLTVNINQAYETLIDKDKRLAYDIQLIDRITKQR